MFEREIGELYEAVGRAKRIMVTATEREDGDSIASELAIKYIIEEAFPHAGKTIHIINENPCPKRYFFLVGAEEILPLSATGIGAYDLGIVLDCGADRTGGVKPIFNACPFRVKIDHHSFGNEGHYNIEIGSNQVASTTEVLFHFVDSQEWGIVLDQPLAELIFVGIIADTGSFQYDLTRPSTHLITARLMETGFDFTRTAERVRLSRSFEMKKLLGLVLNEMCIAPHGNYLWSVMTRQMVADSQARADDVGDIIDEICFINGVEVTILFVEQGANQVRISFRSKGGLNVGEFARRVTPSGGGHPRASGCSLDVKLSEAIPMILRKLDEELDRAEITDHFNH